MKSIFKFFAALLFALALPCFAQTPVVIAPTPQFVQLDQNGRPLAFGCVFTYQAGTTSPLATFTDFTGTTQNHNPVILSGSGTANIWLQAGQAYTFVVKSFGGNNCSIGSQLYSVTGIGGGASTLTTVVPFSSTPLFTVQAQNQLFTITLTGNASAQPLTFVGLTPPSYVIFQITQDATGGRTFAWPSNAIGGCTIGGSANQVTTQEFIYNGTQAFAIGPCVVGSGPAINVGAVNATSVAATSFPGNPGFPGNPSFTGAPLFDSVTLSAGPGTYDLIPNSATGTIANGAAKLVSGQIQETATTDTQGFLGCVQLGQGATGSAVVQESGQAQCALDGATTDGDYVVISSTTAGNLHDAGATAPQNVQVCGIVMSTNGGSGTYTVLLFPVGGAITQVAKFFDSTSPSLTNSTGTLNTATILTGTLVAGTGPSNGSMIDIYTSVNIANPSGNATSVGLNFGGTSLATGSGATAGTYDAFFQAHCLVVGASSENCMTQVSINGSVFVVYATPAIAISGNIAVTTSVIVSGASVVDTGKNLIVQTK